MRKKHENEIERAAKEGATEPQIEALKRMFQADLDRFDNTWIRHRPEWDDVVVTLHNTNIVEIDSDGLICLYAGGWQTVTTKKRMNQVLEALEPSILGKEMFAVRVWQEDFCWYLCSKHEPEHEFFEEDFEEGIYAGTVA